MKGAGISRLLSHLSAATFSVVRAVLTTRFLDGVFAFTGEVPEPTLGILLLLGTDFALGYPRHLFLIGVKRCSRFGTVPGGNGSRAAVMFLAHN
jgi:hypothetical protein